MDRNKKIEQYLGLPYIINVVPEECTDGSMCYRAFHPELPGCMSHGLTSKEALQNLSEARRLYLETLIEKGETIPLPQEISSDAVYEVAVWTVDPIPPEDKEKENPFLVEIPSTTPHTV